MSQEAKKPQPTFCDLPTDELIRYGRELGVPLSDTTPRGEVLRRIRRRQELLIELDHEALLDVVVWMRRPVRKSASKETLAKEIARHDYADCNGLSERGLRALARLDGLEDVDGDSYEQLKARLERRGGFWSRLRRRRRRLMARAVSRLVEGDREISDYQFLPEEGPASLQREIEDQGVVGGIARKLRGVADDYVREKLDEIELRIDRKLDEIDQRLGEWRDREVANRLRILKVTLVFSILVALVCLVYDWAKPKPAGVPHETKPPAIESPAPSGAEGGDAANVGDERMGV